MADKNDYTYNNVTICITYYNTEKDSISNPPHAAILRLEVVTLKNRPLTEKIHHEVASRFIPTFEEQMGIKILVLLTANIHYEGSKEKDCDICRRREEAKSTYVIEEIIKA